MDALHDSQEKDEGGKLKASIKDGTKIDNFCQFLPEIGRSNDGLTKVLFADLSVHRVAIEHALPSDPDLLAKAEANPVVHIVNKLGLKAI
jgi:hypothetical protein